MKGVALAGALSLGFSSFAAGTSTQSSTKPVPSKASINQRLRQAAAGFTENLGQWDARAKYLSRTRNVDVWITSDGAVYDYYKMAGNGGRTGHVVRMGFDGARNAEVVPVGAAMPGGAIYRNDFGSTPRPAQRFGSVLQKGLYPGIDARYYVDGGKPRYDVLVAPNADASQVRVRFDGAAGVKVRNGEVVLGTKLGTMTHAKPVAYQVTAQGKKLVSAAYAMLDNGSVGVKLGAYDHSRQLVIDPLVYGSYYGGEGGNDEVRNVVSDADGVYLVGRTAAADFPALTGPYGFNIHGGFDAFVAKLRGDAYVNVYSAYFGGTQNDIAQFCTLDPFGNLWIAGRTWSTDFPNNPRDNIQFLNGDQLANGGTFRMSFQGYGNTSILPWNATTTQVFDALNAILPTGTLKSVTAVKGSQLANAVYKIVTDGDLTPGVLSVSSEDNRAGNTSQYGLKPHLFTTVSGNATRIFNPRTVATGGSFTLTFTNPAGTAATTDPIVVNALTGQPTSGSILAALSALTNLNNGTFSVSGSSLSGTANGGGFLVQFTPQNGVPGPANIVVAAQSLSPSPVFTGTKFSDIFVMRWAKDSNLVLNPAGDIVQIFGGDGTEFLAGFAIKQKDNPANNEDVLMGWSGDYVPPFNGSTLVPNELSGNQDNSGFVARYTFNSNVFTKNAGGTKWVEGWAVGAVAGFAMDVDGNGYICGQVGFNGYNDDNPTGSGAFPTTPGIYLNGDKLRFRDAYWRKYDANGQILLSGLLGGNGNESIGGIDFDPHGVTDRVGSAIFVDPQKNIYVTGIARSFNFPRTPGVFGETFNANANVFVTKIAPDGGSLLYSTNLKTTGAIIPAGVSADPAGNAYVAGTAHPNYVDFPETNGQQPGDPEEPIGTDFPTIPLNGALDPDYSSPNGNTEFPTTEGWVIGLNQTATQTLYASWAGGLLDEQVFGPYVDRFGDVWINGWTDSGRGYLRFGTSSIKVYNTSASLPAALISPLAFKATPAASGGTGMTLIYGGYGDHNGDTWGPGSISATYQRDGFLVKLRVGATPSVQSVTLNPNTVPGGLGASSTGTVTLSSPAPGGGADVELKLDNASASFDPNTPVDTMVITIPAGATTGQFTVYTNAVTANTAVAVKATYLGSFQIAQLNVVPWLQGIAVTPNTVVGGNVTSGRITLSAPAGPDGVEVTLSSDTPSLISYPNGTSVTVPAGQTSVNFVVKTSGVDNKSFANVTGSVLGVNRTAAVTLMTAKLLNLTFKPTVVAGLSSTVGTLTLDGEAGPNGFTVTLGNLSASYKISPTSLKFSKGQSVKTFTVTTPYVTTSTSARVVATRAATGGYTASTVSGTFTVVPATIASIQLDPTTVQGGDTSVLTINLSAPAPASGVVVNLSAAPTGIVTIPAQVTIPAGAQAFSVDVPTQVIAADTAVTITAKRSSTDKKTAVLTVQGASIALTLNPTSISGGGQVTGTVTSTRAAGATGLVVNITSSDPAAANPTVSTVTIAPGQTTATFTIQTSVVDSNTMVDITAALPGGASATETLEVRAIGVLSVAFSKSSVTGGQPVSVTITLDANAKAGGTVVNLSATNNQFTILPASVTVPAGTRTYTFTLNTRRVSRDQLTTLTASASGASSSASLLVKRGF